MTVFSQQEMILTSNKKHLKANILYFENIYKKKQELNKYFSHVTLKMRKFFCNFQKVTFFGQFSNFWKKKWRKHLYIDENNLKVTLGLLLYQKNQKKKFYDYPKLRYEPQKIPDFSKKTPFSIKKMFKMLTRYPTHNLKQNYWDRDCKYLNEFCMSIVNCIRIKINFQKQVFSRKTE